jgi:hypothetical protein
MRRRDLYPLREAIDASAIDKMARKVLHDSLEAHMEKEWNDFARTYPNEDVTELYNDFYQYWADTTRPPSGAISAYWLFTRRITDVATRALTQLVHEHLLTHFGNAEKRTVGVRIKKDGKLSVPISIFKVKVDDREDSADDYKDKSGGYFAGRIDSSIIKVFVNRDDLWEAGMGMVQVIALGEGEGYDRLTNVIAPVFTHEYVHLEQFVRGGMGSPQEDWGYITAGGGRRGNRRNPWGGTTANEKLVHWMRYRGSASELEAFAQQTASELVAETLRYRRHQNEVSSEAIRGILDSLATGYADATHMRAYNAIGWGEYSAEAAAAGIKPHEMKIVWRRFMKLTYRAVQNYAAKRLRAGDERSFHIKDAPPTWIKAAKEHTLGQTANTIAYEIADAMLGEVGWYKTGEQAAQYDERITKATSFLNSVYFPEDNYERDHWTTIHRLLKQVVAKIFDREKEKLQKAA